MTPFIDIQNVSINFGNKNILSDIYLSLIPNHIITLIGPNGAGKSTLVRVVLGLIKPNKGTIIRVQNLRIGYVPQKLNFNTNFPISVNKFMHLFHNVHQDQIISMLDRVHVLHLKDCQLQKLSGGELQKVLLANALLDYPNVLVLDEPTQGIDLSGRIMFYELIHTIRNEFSCAVLMVSHDLNFVMARTDEVICLNKKICCSGTPQSVTKNAKFITMFGAQELNELALYRHNHNFE